MECTQNIPLSNREFLINFNRKTSQSRIPVSGSIDLTHCCNLRCVHCYLGWQTDRGNEMKSGRIMSIIDEITEAGCLFLLITGGEPLLRNDFPEVYRHAKKKGLLITVFTNGTKINNAVLDLFEELPPHVVEISLYGATATTYERITGVPGSFDKCLYGIRQLLDRKINVRLKTILMTLNDHEFFDIERMAEELGVKFRFDAAIFPYMNGDKSPIKLRVLPETVVQKEFSNRERTIEWGKYFERARKQALSDKLYSCGAGLTSFHIDTYGNLQPCIMMNGIRYNLLEGSFLAGWNGVISRIRDREAGGAYKCNHCEKRHLCGFCPAFFRLENGSEVISSDYLCTVGGHRFDILNKIKLQGVQDAA